ncbi:MAG TPA: hypothetical protein VKI01_02605 [Acidimicrobiia bacterium]|nr:hypothetical protein [Acidimicrobiia bacterium]
MATTDDEGLSRAVRTRGDAESLSGDERARLTRWIAELDPVGPPPGARRRRLEILTIATVGAIVLVPWIAFLSVTLPQRHASSGWRFAWVGFDVALVTALATTAWYTLKRRQAVLMVLLISGVLLVCDAWFDVVLSWGTSDAVASILTAAFIELPLAVLFFSTYHRVLRALTHRVWVQQGRPGEPPPLHLMPLLFAPPPLRTPSSP